VVSGTDVVGHVGERLEVIAGGVGLSSASSVEVTGGDMSVSSDGSMTGFASGSVELGGASLAGRVTGGAAGVVGGEASLLVGGAVSVESGGAGSATFGDGVSLSGGSVMLESGDGLVGVARSVDVVGSESVRVGSTGAVVELSGSGDMEYVGFVWRSSSSFDEFESMLTEVITDVEEVLIRSMAPGGAQVVSTGGGGTGVHMELAAATTASSSWHRVWGSTMGSGSYSLDGLHVQFERQDVGGIRFGSSLGSGPTYQGWAAVMVHFGRATGAGAVRVTAASVLEAVSGESLSVMSEAVSVSAGRSLEVSGGETVSVSGDVVSVSAQSLLEASAVSASLSVGDSLDVLSGGAVSVTSVTASLSSSGAVSVVSSEPLCMFFVSSFLIFVSSFLSCCFAARGRSIDFLGLFCCRGVCWRKSPCHFFR